MKYKAYKYLIVSVFILMNTIAYSQQGTTKKEYYYYHYTYAPDPGSTPVYFIVSTVFTARVGLTEDYIKEQWTETLVLEDLSRYDALGTYRFLPRTETREETEKKRRSEMAKWKKRGYTIVEVNFTYRP